MSESDRPERFLRHGPIRCIMKKILVEVTAMGVEYELKFRADRAVQASILAQIPGQDQVFSMQTTRSSFLSFHAS